MSTYQVRPSQSPFSYTVIEAKSFELHEGAYIFSDKDGAEVGRFNSRDVYGITKQDAVKED